MSFSALASLWATAIAIINSRTISVQDPLGPRGQPLLCSILVLSLPEVDSASNLIFVQEAVHLSRGHLAWAIIVGSPGIRVGHEVQ